MNIFLFIISSPRISVEGIPPFFFLATSGGNRHLNRPRHHHEGCGKFSLFELFFFRVALGSSKLSWERGVTLLSGGSYSIVRA